MPNAFRMLLISLFIIRFELLLAKDTFWFSHWKKVLCLKSHLWWIPIRFKEIKTFSFPRHRIAVVLRIQWAKTLIQSLWSISKHVFGDFISFHFPRVWKYVNLPFLATGFVKPLAFFPAKHQQSDSYFK